MIYLPEQSLRIIFYFYMLQEPGHCCKIISHLNESQPMPFKKNPNKHDKFIDLYCKKMFFINLFSYPLKQSPCYYLINYIKISIKKKYKEFAFFFLFETKFQI